ncbi:hypothetical protein [Sphingobium sp. MK2]
MTNKKSLETGAHIVSPIALLRPRRNHATMVFYGKIGRTALPDTVRRTI